MVALTQLQKYIHERHLAELVDQLCTYFVGGVSVFIAGHIACTLYAVQAGETSDAEAFVRELVQRVPQHGDALMTIAQQPEQKGIEKGKF